jgi:hypothetical protein
MDSLDAPELVALLQSAGFTLGSIGFIASNNVKRDGNNGGCRVIVECPTSGVRAELSGPATALCRCTRFSGNNDIQNVQEQSSFWHITTILSQVSTLDASLNLANIFSIFSNNSCACTYYIPCTTFYYLLSKQMVYNLTNKFY